MPFKVHGWETEGINKAWDGLCGALVFSSPRLGEDLVVLTNLPPFHTLVNLGQVTQVAYEDGSGRNFLVRTNRFGDRGELFVQLVDGVRATAGLPIEGMRA